MAKHGEKTKALAYMRTSSATNAGLGRDSERRQRQAIESFAKAAGYSIEEWFYDAAVSGADDINDREGFAAMLKRIASNGVRVIIVETANRFARDLMVQETGHAMLRKLGIELVAADSPDAFVHDTPTAVMVRQILGAVAQFEKAALVAKLKGARDRKRARGERVEGRKPAHETYPLAVTAAKALRRASPKTGERMSYRSIAAKLAAEGTVTKGGKPFTAMAIKRMVEGPAPKAKTEVR
ncbi:MAG: recombinase family protein [Hyphomicrobium sp.]|uniref:recombinase family protein n=1 Tax=Hyphomicrobium sp. TaxID=82 RepID=UPI001320F4A6|nr:recombinase family protein [Hyphomicrobium sp.]KAB2942540.1 MAG: serine recombinase [Hyphomicrobium sp.]MBZ0208511.1 recombinase family protein [Hyphomicrobium sp.]